MAITFRQAINKLSQPSREKFRDVFAKSIITKEESMPEAIKALKLYEERRDGEASGILKKVAASYSDAVQDWNKAQNAGLKLRNKEKTNMYDWAAQANLIVCMIDDIEGKNRNLVYELINILAIYKELSELNFPVSWTIEARERAEVINELFSIVSNDGMVNPNLRDWTSKYR
ncbi:MAG: hypothetical protein ABIH83_03270 [Candidatus Micrarchaeota archaeon]